MLPSNEERKYVALTAAAQTLSIHL